MFKIKRFATILLCITLFIPLPLSAQENPPRVVATASMIADMAQTIAGDRLEVACIVPIGSDPHLHDPNPGDARLVSEADLILVNGLTFEGWLGKLIANSGTSAVIDTVTRGITPIGSQTYQNAVDPHAWMDASNGLVYIKNIAETLIALDPANEEVYRFNYRLYKQQLEDLDSYIFEKISSIPKEKRVLITSHDAFHYYGKRYGLQLESLLGTSTDADIQTEDIIRISKLIGDRQIPAVFVESTVNPKVLEQMASDQNIAIGGELYADSIGDEDSPAPSYEAMLKHNTDVIVAGLTGEWSGSQAVISKSLLWWILAPVVLLIGLAIFYATRKTGS